MADELQLAPEEELDPIDVPVEDEAPPVPKTVEDFARERGWKPQEEFEGGDGKEWRDAETFLAYGLDRTRELSGDVKHLRETTERMARTQADITQQAIDRARAEDRREWEARLKEAVELGDQSAVFSATQKIAELAQPAPAQPQGDPAVARFAQENTWLRTDPIAASVATAAAQIVADRNGSVEEQLQAAREAVHKRFPEYAPAQAKPAASVSAPANRVAAARTVKKGFSDLPAEAQMVAKQMVARKLLPNVDAYVTEYFGGGASA